MYVYIYVVFAATHDKYEKLLFCMCSLSLNVERLLVTVFQGTTDLRTLYMWHILIECDIKLKILICSYSLR
jgi:hypothetical protein